MRRLTSRLTPGAMRNPSDPATLIHSYDSDINPSRPAKSSPLGSSTIAGLPLELLDRLRAFPLFRTAPESFLLSIGKSLRPSIYQPAQEIIREGEDAKAMYWVVRGSVRVTSRDGESTYAELKPGAFFGEIGILMDIPRTATIVATVRSLVVRLNKEDLQKELPQYPEVERAIREEALERLAILERKKKERAPGESLRRGEDVAQPTPAAPRKRSRDWVAGDVEMGDIGQLIDGEVLSNKKRKSPSPGVVDLATVSAVGGASAVDGVPLTIRQLLKELPLFSGLPSDILHFLGVNAQPVSFPPFTEILRQGSQGRDVYFIFRGEVEVLVSAPDSRRESGKAHVESLPQTEAQPREKVRARLKVGQYFGEVTSLSLAPRRTATVRSVNSVECLLISGEVLNELWRRCSPNLRQQVESEAKRRLKDVKKDDDVTMTDLDSSPVGGVPPAYPDGEDEESDWRKALPTVTFDEPPPGLENASSPISQMEPLDPDPFFNPELDNMRSKSRRGSIAPFPLSPQASAESQYAVPSSPLTDGNRAPSPPSAARLHSPLRPKQSPTDSPTSPSRLSPTATRRSSLDRRPSSFGKGRLPDQMLVLILQHLELLDLMRLRLVSMHWLNLLTTSPDILHYLRLSLYNTYVTDQVLKEIIIPFARNRAKEIDLSNCFHVTDEGFKLLAEACGEGVRTWRMKSVWDVSGPAVLGLVERAKDLEEIDLSNCRKVGDNLLARVVGWVVADVPTGGKSLPPSALPITNGKRQLAKRSHSSSHQQQQSQRGEPPPPPPGTIIGAHKLKHLALSYCKHIQDRSMAHLALHASERLESLDLTRCTSISDAGFASWPHHPFPNLRTLILADCTYLSDAAVVSIVGGCRALRDLDLSFCCALSDTATEVLALGLPGLHRLNMAFCGSAVSDASLRCIGRHLLELRYLSVRGCVRVTGQGVEAVVEGCGRLGVFDVSQCKNLRGWVERGGVRRCGGRGLGGHGEGSGEATGLKFGIVADGSWRGGR